MGNQRTSGLQKRGGVWHIDKKFRGARICESTGTGDIGLRSRSLRAFAGYIQSMYSCARKRKSARRDQ